ncbi:alpha/beta fold hydrolase [Nonomuraea sp. NPDC049637]|uniref:alpha/beta fold hydrolase n=1 Tax=Nonomuraea sp. NPDC049637 TaxID=3154356 RepID=UPI0034481D72
MEDAVVFGATGFIGRWTVLHLLEQGRAVTAVVRRADGGLGRWLRERGAPGARLTVVEGDVTAGPGLGLSGPAEGAAGVRDVFNAAGVYRFGMEREEARTVNVEGALNVLNWAAARPALRRLVHVSGYRVGLDPRPRHPLPEAELAALYRDKGAYEGSKAEGDAAVRVAAARLGVPLTVVNPSSVIGHSLTGEAGQYVGPASLVRDLWAGRLPALPGGARTFVPVVTVDDFARFMAAVPEHDPEPGGLHWVLDPATPDLPDLIRLLADHLGVRAPRIRVPVGVIRRLPSALTGAEPETLGFLTEDRYDTGSADRVAASARLRRPPVEDALRRWADRLVADRFGAAPAARPGGFHSVAGSRTYVAGERTSPRLVLLHGLPLDGDSWHGVLDELDSAPPATRPGTAADRFPELAAGSPAPDRSPTLAAGSPAPDRSPTLAAGSPAPDRFPGLVAGFPASDRFPALVADLPGLGRSSPAGAAASDWLAELLAPVRTRPVIVAHSAAAAPALRYAAAHPGRIAALILLSPYFLQRRPSALTLLLAAPVLGRMGPDRLAATLLGPASPPEDARRAVASAAAGLRRPGVARRTARVLRAAHRPAERAALRTLLGGPVPVHLVAGELDPLTDSPVPVTVIPGAGHHPHLTHPAAVAEIVRQILLRPGVDDFPPPPTPDIMTGPLPHHPRTS